MDPKEYMKQFSKYSKQTELRNAKESIPITLKSNPNGLQYVYGLDKSQPIFTAVVYKRSRHYLFVRIKKKEYELPKRFCPHHYINKEVVLVNIPTWLIDKLGITSKQYSVENKYILR